MQAKDKRKALARRLRDDAATVREKLEHDGDAIADRMKQAADLLDGRAEEGIKQIPRFLKDTAPPHPTSRGSPWAL